MTCSSLLLVCAFSLLAAVARTAVVEHTFHVGNLKVRKLCQERVVVAVNGQMPGPTIQAHEGDTVIVHVINESPHNMTIHWHGVFQLLSAWADGPAYVTQCPIRPGNNYTYKFDVVGQEGTLWWHAHVSFLRATVHGALIILPRAGPRAYPFPQPHAEVPILLGEWWNGDVVQVETAALAVGKLPNISDAFAINGMPGHLYPCSTEDMYKLTVVPGKTYLFRIINVAVYGQLFYKVAGHTLTVVAVDGSYTTPRRTDTVVIAPGQTLDALLVSDAPPGRYFMAARPYATALLIDFNNSTTTAILQYEATTAMSRWQLLPPSTVMPILPASDDTMTAHTFYSNLTSLLRPGDPTVPLVLDEKMFVTFGMGLIPCDKSVPCEGPMAEKLAGSMNNISFMAPTKPSLLEAHRHFNPSDGVVVYTSDFPDKPVSAAFEYASPYVTFNFGLMQTEKGARLKKLKYNSTVEVVLQNTAVLGAENHPMHLHGFNFFVLAQGFGNYDPATAEKGFNLVNPQVRNTIAVPTAGWAVIRFVANNPGVWLMHCHMDMHASWGMGMAFAVEDGLTPSSQLPPPPTDLPRC